MNNINCLLKSERYKLFHDKKCIKIFLVFLCVFILVFTVSAVCYANIQNTGEPIEISEEYRSKERIAYQNSYEYDLNYYNKCSKWYAEHPNYPKDSAYALPDGGTFFYPSMIKAQQNYLYCQYLLENDLYEYQLCSFPSNINNYTEPSYIMYTMGQLFSFVGIGLSILLTMKVFVFCRKADKNIVVSKVNRKECFYARLLFVVIMLAILNAFIFIYGAIAGLFSLNTYNIFFFPSKVIAIPSIIVYLSICIGYFFVDLLFLALTLMLSCIIKKKIVVGLLPILIYFFLIFLSVSIGGDLLFYEAHQWYPILSLQITAQLSFCSWQFYFWLGIHLISSIIMVLVARIRYSKMDL